MNANELREKIEELDARIEALTMDAKPIREQLANLDRQRDKLRNERAELGRKLEEMKAKPRVSDHAVIRYLERKYGFTFEDVRKELLTPAVLQAMEMGAAGVRMNGGLLKLKGKTIVTYVNYGTHGRIIRSAARRLRLTAGGNSATLPKWYNAASRARGRFAHRVRRRAWRLKSPR